MSKLIPSIHQSFLIFYTFLNPAHITLLALPYKAAAVYYYLMPVIGPFILNTLIPYLKAIYTILNLSKSYLGTALKIQRLPIQPSQD